MCYNWIEIYKEYTSDYNGYFDKSQDEYIISKTLQKSNLY